MHRCRFPGRRGRISIRLTAAWRFGHALLQTIDRPIAHSLELVELRMSFRDIGGTVMKDGGDNEFFSLDDIQSLVADVFQRAGASKSVAQTMGHSIKLAERDGMRQYGLALVPTMIEHIRSGRVDARAEPVAHWDGPTTLKVNASSGFACPAIDPYLAELTDRAADHGLAHMAVTRAYPIHKPHLTVEWIAQQGMTGSIHCVGLSQIPIENDMTRLTCVGQVLTAQPAPDESVRFSNDPKTPLTGEPKRIRFEGPLGPSLAFSHSILAATARTIPSIRFQKTNGDQALQGTRKTSHQIGVTIESDLLEAIINA